MTFSQLDCSVRYRLYTIQKNTRGCKTLFYDWLWKCLSGYAPVFSTGPSCVFVVFSCRFTGTCLVQSKQKKWRSQTCLSGAEDTTGPPNFQRFFPLMRCSKTNMQRCSPQGRHCPEPCGPPCQYESDWRGFKRLRIHPQTNFCEDKSNWGGQRG